MSNKTQLQTNNTTLASLIQTLQGKAAGGGGSGGVETCTVRVTAVSSSYRARQISYTTMNASGKIVAGYYDNSSSALQIDLENVVCGSSVGVYWNNMASDICTKAAALTNPGVLFSVYSIGASVGETAIIQRVSGAGSG